MMKNFTLISGAAIGSEETFGEFAEKHNIEEINYTFEGHDDHRNRGLKVLSEAELEKSCISLKEVTEIMHRKYPNTPTFKKILQTIWYLIEEGEEVFVVGKIQDDKTVKGGTGWAAEFAKQSKKPLFVFDQEQDGWFSWTGSDWQAESDVKITKAKFTGTGSRHLLDSGKAAIADLFAKSFS
jgi:hypothetical protein